MGKKELDAVAFPALDAGQMAEIARCAGNARPARYRAGQVIIRAGERDFKFFVVESGEIEVLDPTADPPESVAVHGPGQFTGDVTHLSGGPALVSVVARRDSEVYEVSPGVLRDILNRCPVLSDLVLSAFIARRQLLREPGRFTGPRVIGSRYSQGTFRVRDFLARNHVPFTWLDLETEPAVGDVLRRFGLCRGSDVVVVGGGNSAGQAAVFLAGEVRKVYHLVRGDSLHKDMSSYLARRIEETPNIEVHLRTTVRRLTGDRCLRAVEIFDDRTGEARTLETPALFSFIGAVPRTDWLPREIVTDKKGFVCTGASGASAPAWNLKRPPFLLETSHPGVFAAGDVREGSIKRVASAVGEGAMTVRFVHEVLKER